jgi:peptidoglycan hydrolase CwlO-like protein
VEQKISMEEPRLNPQVKDAQESVEELISSLEDTKKLAVTNYQSELARVEEDIKKTDFRNYRRPRS